jgi:hypothetical protein
MTPIDWQARALAAEADLNNALDRAASNLARAIAAEAENATLRAENAALRAHDDYDCGLLNDYGGGNVDWWWDYIRAEVGRANEHWREALPAAQAACQAHADEVVRGLLRP